MDDLDPLLGALPKAIAEARQRQVSTLTVLAQTQKLEPTALLETFAARLGLQLASQDDIDATTCCWDHIDLREAKQLRMLELQTGSGLATALLDDPWNDDAIRLLTERIGSRPQLLFAAPDVLQRLLQSASGSVKAARANRNEGKRALEARAPEQRGQVVEFVDRLIEAAFDSHASDIHFECTREGLETKFRLDGILLGMESIDEQAMAEQVVSRLKVMAELDIAERRVPQDGRFSIELGGRSVDCRVSVMPSAHGEDVVIRILDKRHLAADGTSLTLASLGFDGATRSTLDTLGRQPHGMLLVTGPTGSGKTTTLYALLGEIRTGTEKIVTIEDPIEYDVPGVLQVPVNEKKGLTFARGLRSILRHDPDVIMVGEIRDRETADIAVQSALTGHLVLTTVHANSALDVVSRFTHIGLDLYAFASCLNGVASQRLLRLNCNHCSVPDETSRATFQQLWPQSRASATLMRGVGCEACRGTGFLGRTAIAEVLVMNDELRDLLVSRAPLVTLRNTSSRALGRSILDSAYQLVAEGRTTLNEVRRVVAVA